MAIRACDFYSLADRAHDLVGEVMRMMRAGKAIACAEEEINRVGGWTRPALSWPRVSESLAQLSDSWKESETPDRRDASGSRVEAPAATGPPKLPALKHGVERGS